MARNNGGFILIKINKYLTDITADDFDKKVFREICEKNIKKPLILETLNSSVVFPFCTNTGVSCGYSYIATQSEEDLSAISGYIQVDIGYAVEDDKISWTYIDV